MASNKKTIVLGLDYSQFSGGITEVNRKMGLLDQEFKLASEMAKQYGSETDKLQLKEEQLTQKIALQNQKLEEAKKKYDDVMSSKDRNSKKSDDADKALLRERTALEKLNNELAANKVRMDQVAMSDIDRKMALLQQEFELASEKSKSFAKDTEQLTQKSSLLSDKIALQAQKVELTKKAYDDARASGEMNEQQLDALYSAYLQNETALSKLNNELHDNDEKVRNSETSTRTFGDTIRGVASAIGVDVSPAVEALASKFDGVSESTGTAVLTLGTMVTTLGKMALSTASHAGEVEELSHKYGLAVSTVQELMYAEDYLEVSVDQIGSSMQKMTKNMDAARGGTGDAAEAFKKLHIKITESNGQLRDSEQVFYNTIDALGKVQNETERNALSMSIFGKSASELNNLILEGSKGMIGYQQDAHKVGAVMSDELVSSAASTDDAMEQLKEKFKGVGTTLGSSVLPVIDTFAKIMDAIPQPIMTGVIVFGALAIAAVLVTKAIAEFKIATTAAAAANAVLSGSNIALGLTGTIATAGMGPLLIVLLAIAAVIGLIVAGASAMDSTMSKVKDTVSQVTDNTNNMMKNVSATNNSVEMIKVKSEQYGNSYYVPSTTTGRGYASGTDFYPGGEAWVGEGGPERVVLPRGSKIYSNAQSKELAGGDNFYVTLNVNTEDIDDIQKLIRTLDGLRQKSRQGKVR